MQNLVQIGLNWNYQLELSLAASHEQVPTIVIKRLETDKTTIPGCYGVWCMVGLVPHSCENKAISAPSWGLAGWGLG